MVDDRAPIKMVEYIGFCIRPTIKYQDMLKSVKNISCRAQVIAIANIYNQGGKNKLIYRASILPILEGPYIVMVE